MQADRFPRRLKRGLDRAWPWFLLKTLTQNGLIFVGATAAVFQLAGWDGDTTALLSATALGLVWGTYTLAMPASRDIALKDIDSRITIRRGDLFAEPSHKVVAVGELFDWELGDRVARGSLHGKCIVEMFGGDGSRFRDSIDASLAELGHIGEIWREGERPRYSIGTTAIVSVPPYKLFLPALTHCDVDDGWKAYATVADLWTALDGLWRSIRTRSNAEPVAVPLMGSGLANVGIPTQSILELIILSFTRASGTARVTERLTIVLTESLYESVDLRKLVEP